MRCASRPPRSWWRRQQIGVLLAVAHDGPRGRHGIGNDQQFELVDAGRRFRDTGDGVAAVAHDEHGLQVVLLGHLLLGQQRRVEPAGRRDARRVHHLDRLAVGARDGVEARRHPRRNRPPIRGTNASTRLRPGRSRAAASRYRGRDRWRPARWCGRGRCWRRCRTCRRCRSPAARCRTRARWRCRPCAGSRPCTRSASPASPSQTSWRRARAARPARRTRARPPRASTSSTSLRMSSMP